MSRTPEMILGIIGGVLGLLGAIFAIFLGGIGGAFGAQGAETITGLGFLAVIASIIGIVGTALVNSRTKLAGALMLVSAVLGLIAIYLFYALGTVLLGIAGILALVRKDEIKKEIKKKR